MAKQQYICYECYFMVESWPAASDVASVSRGFLYLVQLRDVCRLRVTCLYVKSQSEPHRKQSLFHWNY
jgi:hypothetical protein